MKNDKHWAENLRDGRHLYRFEIERIVSLNIQIKELQSKIDRLTKQRTLEENELFWKSLDRFNIEQITQAKEENA